MRTSTLSVVFSLMLALALPAGAQTSSNSQRGALDVRVEQALRAANIANVEDIEVEVKGDAALLSGFVESEADQEKALQAARAVPGVATVRNDLVVRESRPTVGQALDDTIIAAQVRKQLSSNVDANGAINVAVNNGVVQLSGYVPSAELKNRAAEVASAVQGVQDVRNDIALSNAR